MIFLYVFFLIIATILPAIIWLMLFLKEDLHPEPKRLIIYTFCIGVLVSLPVLLLQLSYQKWLGSDQSKILLLVIGLALIEEVFKFFAAYFSVHNDPAFDEPIDAMIYMIAAALGFATIENFLVISNTLNFAQPFFSTTVNSIQTMALRFVGATLLHTLTSGLIGYYWAKSRLVKHGPALIIQGFVYATLIHAIFNFLVLRFQSNSLIYPSIFLVFILFFLLHDFEKIKAAPPAANDSTSVDLV
ncbi:MAG: PrsW family glutamic-type intramembrane protease [Patescibacteria group bacterium]